jgi:hypothetical protein
MKGCQNSQNFTSFFWGKKGFGHWLGFNGICKNTHA